MERTLIKDLREKIDQQVTLKGWLQTLRDQKSMQFLILRDRTGLAQVAHWKKGNLDLAELISTLGTESALTITGKVVANEVVKLGGIEIQLESLKVENNAELPLPFEPFNDTLPDQDYRLDWRYLDLRRERNRLIFEIQTTLEQAMREYWLANGFIEVHSPRSWAHPVKAEQNSSKSTTLTALPTWHNHPSFTSKWHRQLVLNAFSRSVPFFGRIPPLLRAI